MSERKAKLDRNLVCREIQNLNPAIRDLLRAHGAITDETLMFRLVELEKRAWQLGELICQILQLEEGALVWTRLPPRPLNQEELRKHADNGTNAVRRVELATECFYMIAFRVVDLAKRIPKLRFDPRGVRLVRNHLIVHPEMQEGSLGASFGAGGDKGPVLHNIRQQPSAHHKDQGLWENAEEFARLLRQRVEKYQLEIHPSDAS